MSNEILKLEKAQEGKTGWLEYNLSETVIVSVLNEGWRLTGIAYNGSLVDGHPCFHIYGSKSGRYTTNDVNDIEIDILFEYEIRFTDACETSIWFRNPEDGEYSGSDVFLMTALLTTFENDITNANK